MVDCVLTDSVKNRNDIFVFSVVVVGRVYAAGVIYKVPLLTFSNSYFFRSLPVNPPRLTSTFIYYFVKLFDGQTEPNFYPFVLANIVQGPRSGSTTI